MRLLSLLLLVSLVGGAHASVAPAGPAAADALTVARAMNPDPSLVVGASWTAYAGSSGMEPAGVADAPISTMFGMPDGPEFAVLSSGRAVETDAGPQSTGVSTALGGSYNGANDATVLAIDLATGNSNCLIFTFQFMSDEYPEWVGSNYNDAFIAELDTHSWTVSGATITAPDNFAYDALSPGPPYPEISINSATMTAGNAAGSVHDGATGLMAARTPLPPGGSHTLYLSIFDAFDSVLDSAVLLDNLQVSIANPPTACVPGAFLAPNASFSSVPACHNFEYAFTDLSSSMATNILTVHWDFGDGTTQGPLPWPGDTTHYYSAPGTYPVTLTVTDDAGFTMTNTQQVDVCNNPPDASGIAIVACVGNAVSARLQGGDPNGDDVTFSVDASTVPAGLHLDSATGRITGTPVASGPITTSIAAMATDEHGAQAAIVAPFRLVDCSSFSLSPGDLDGDGIPDDDDVCPDVWDQAQADSDGDGVGDACVPGRGTTTPAPAVPELPQPTSPAATASTNDDAPGVSCGATIVEDVAVERAPGGLHVTWQADAACGTFTLWLDGAAAATVDAGLRAAFLPADGGAHTVGVTHGSGAPQTVAVAAEAAMAAPSVASQADTGRHAEAAAPPAVAAPLWLALLAGAAAVAGVVAGAVVVRR